MGSSPGTMSVDADGGLAKNTRRLDLHGLLAESDAHDAAPEVETGSQTRTGMFQWRSTSPT